MAEKLPSTIWMAKAKLYDKQKKLVGCSIDTPNAIAKALMEHPNIEFVQSLEGRKTRQSYIDRMKSWNVAKSGFAKC